MREQSAYLPAWRAAVKQAVYERYKALGVLPGDLPLLVGPVAVRCSFALDTGARIDAPPDLDKLLRGVWDALTQARVIEDDGRIVTVYAGKKAAATPGETGVEIEIWRTP